MMTLNIYFNELSIIYKYNSEAEVYNCILKLTACLDNILSIRSDVEIKFPFSILDKDILGTSLRNRIKQCQSNKDRYLRLISKFKQLKNEEIPLDTNVYHNDESAIALTLADKTKAEFGNGWVISVVNSSGFWCNNEIYGVRVALSESGELPPSTICIIDNFSKPDHTEKSKQALLDWGNSVAPSCVIGEISGHPIVMYSAPLEHNPPHVHLLVNSGGATLAKYRIKDFEREKGNNDFDKEMKAWLIKYREQLLRSWQRCQLGLHPYKIKD